MKKICIALVAIYCTLSLFSQENVRYRWDKFSSEYGDIDIPNKGTTQTASLIADISGDNISDFIIVEKTEAPAIVVYVFKSEKKWEKYTIERRKIDAGESIACADIDGDGDLDLVVGSEDDNKIWWWENPSPDLSKPWRRKYVKRSGEPLHQDMAFGDFDGDGKQELAFWNQGEKALFVAKIPDNLDKADEWPREKIFTYSTDGQMQQHSKGTERLINGINYHAGIDVADVDGDGIDDILAGGSWFKFVNGSYQINYIDLGYVSARIACGQLIPEGRPEVVMVAGDGIGPILMYRFEDGIWMPETLDNTTKRAHTLEIIDFDKDGYNDIFVAEMKTREVRDPRTFILLNDGTGHFQHVVVGNMGSHNGAIGDIDGDGDYDVVGKPYQWDTPRIDLWINMGKRLK